MENKASLYNGKKYIVKLTFPYDWPIMRQTKAWSGEWENYKFILNDDINECDFWIIFTDHNFHKKETCICPSQNVIFMPSEPYSIARFSKQFLKQFALIITCQREIVHPNVSYNLGGHPWFVNKSYDELIENQFIIKTKKISLVVSNKVQTEGHKKRLDFSYNLKDYFKDEIDLFGRGINDFDDKWDVLAPYQYSITMENSNYDDYLSEKFFDCHLAFTYPFYYGCPNAEKYFSEKSFTRIDINDFEFTIRTIENILNDDQHYNRHLKYIQTERLKVLNNYNLFPLLVSYMRNMNGDAMHENVSISPDMSFLKYLSYIKRIIKK